MCSSQLLSCVRLFAALWLLCPWNISGKKTGVGCLLLQIFLTQGWNLCLFLHWQVHSLSLSHLGSPTYTYNLFFFRFFSDIGYCRILSRFPCAIQQVLINYLFYTQQCVDVNPSLQIYPISPSPFGIHSLFLYSVVSLICEIQKNGTDELIDKAEVETQCFSFDNHNFLSDTL